MASSRSRSPAKIVTTLMVDVLKQKKNSLAETSLVGSFRI